MAVHVFSVNKHCPNTVWQGCARPHPTAVREVLGPTFPLALGAVQHSDFASLACVQWCPVAVLIWT